MKNEIGNQVITAIPIYSDAAFEKFKRAEAILREVCAESINMDTWTFFRMQPIGIGGVQFLDARELHKNRKEHQEQIENDKR